MATDAVGAHETKLLEALFSTKPQEKSCSNGKERVTDNEDNCNEKEGQDARLFFNYHEYMVSYYIDIDGSEGPREHDEEHSLCITHFPNVYVPRQSSEFSSTRIVRIPRYENARNFPSFSTYIPGSEPAAITSGEGETLEFIPQGIYGDTHQKFGYTSVSPLSKYLTSGEFVQIVTEINSILENTYRVYSWSNLFGFCLELLTLGLWPLVARKLYSDPLAKLDQYLDQVNGSSIFQANGIRIISPRRSAFVSLDFEIPKP